MAKSKLITGELKEFVESMNRIDEKRNGKKIRFNWVKKKRRG